MSHAGVPSFWNSEQARKHAQELEEVLRGKNHVTYFENMYGNTPDQWDESLNGMDRWRCITNYFTRMRWIDSCGKLEFASKGPLSQQPQGYEPWFLQARNPVLKPTLLFGHWAALEGVTNNSRHVALDTGCVWGERLTALCLETQILYSVPAQEI
jgi:bis(5'-nucleosyl)-tetraphosphatase (symmetrical)